MATLPNPKHEQFALLLSRGFTQIDAYVKAGYLHNKPAASRLASSVVIKNRVAELKEELKATVTSVVVQDEKELGALVEAESLREIGITKVWVAEQFKQIYKKAVTEGRLNDANNAMSNIQKMVEIEDKANEALPVEQKEERIRVTDALAMLKGMKEILSSDTELNIIDVTPPESTYVMLPEQEEE